MSWTNVTRRKSLNHCNPANTLILICTMLKKTNARISQVRVNTKTATIAAAANEADDGRSGLYAKEDRFDETH